MSDRSTTSTVNFRDWIRGEGEFSEENLRKARDEFFTKLGQRLHQKLLEAMDKALFDHDAPVAQLAEQPFCERPATGSSPVGGSLDVVPDAKADGQGRGNPDTPDHVGTGNTQKPVAWAVRSAFCDTGIVDLCRTLADCRDKWPNSVTDSWRYVPLYRSPQPTLTDAEREAINVARIELNTLRCFEDHYSHTLLKLLERTQ